MKNARIAIALAALVALIAAPALGQKRSDRNQVITVAYGTVIGTEVVKLDSNAAKGAAVGALVHCRHMVYVALARCPAFAIVRHGLSGRV